MKDDYEIVNVLLMNFLYQLEVSPVTSAEVEYSKMAIKDLMQYIAHYRLIPPKDVLEMYRKDVIKSRSNNEESVLFSTHYDIATVILDELMAIKQYYLKKGD